MSVLEDGQMLCKTVWSWDDDETTLAVGHRKEFHAAGAAVTKRREP